MLSILHNKNDEKIFEREYYIVKSPAFKKYIPEIEIAYANKHFFIPEYLSRCAKIKKNTASIVKEKAND